MIKALSKVGLKKNFPHLDKECLQKNLQLTSYLMVKFVNLSCASLRARQVCSPSPLLFNIIPEVLANVVRQETQITGIQTGKETIQLFLFSDEMITYVANPKETPTTNK